MDQNVIRWTVLLCASAVAGVEACGGDNAGSDAGNDATSSDAAAADVAASDAAQDAPFDHTVVNEAGSDAGLDAADGGCASLTDGGCFQCCADEDPDAAMAFAQRAIICACDNPGECTTACSSTLCNGKAPSSNCIACLMAPDAGACIASLASTVCGDADTVCLATAACFMTCE